MARKKITERASIRSPLKRNKAETKSADLDPSSASEDEILSQVIKNVNRKTKKRSENDGEQKLLSFDISDSDDSEAGVSNNKKVQESPRGKRRSASYEKTPPKKVVHAKSTTRKSRKESTDNEEEEQNGESDSDAENSVRKKKGERSPKKSIRSPNVKTPPKKRKHSVESEDDEEEINSNLEEESNKKKSLKSPKKSPSKKNKDSGDEENEEISVRKSSRQSSRPTKGSPVKNLRGNFDKETVTRRSSRATKVRSDSEKESEKEGENVEEDESADDTLTDEPAKKKYEGPKIYEVEKIISHTGDGKNRYFQIRWKGYTEESDTWEPITKLSCPKLIEEYYCEVNAFEFHFNKKLIFLVPLESGSETESQAKSSKEIAKEEEEARYRTQSEDR